MDSSLVYRLVNLEDVELGSRFCSSTLASCSYNISPKYHKAPKLRAVYGPKVLWNECSQNPPMKGNQWQLQIFSFSASPENVFEKEHEEAVYIKPTLLYDSRY